MLLAVPLAVVTPIKLRIQTCAQTKTLAVDRVRNQAPYITTGKHRIETRLKQAQIAGIKLQSWLDARHQYSTSIRIFECPLHFFVALALTFVDDVILNLVIRRGCRPIEHRIPYGDHSRRMTIHQVGWRRVSDHHRPDAPTAIARHQLIAHLGLHSLDLDPPVRRSNLVEAGRSPRGHALPYTAPSHRGPGKRALPGAAHAAPKAARAASPPPGNASSQGS